MIETIKKTLRVALREIGYDIVPSRAAQPIDECPADFDQRMIDIWHEVQPFTMTSPERIYALCKSVEYIVQNNIPGDIVECGVWKGGSMMAVARTLMDLCSERTLYLFDTFEGMPEPIGLDKDFKGRLAADRMLVADKATSMMWAYSELDDVKRNLRRVGYDSNRLVFVKGKIEKTIPQQSPARVSLLRLDTDWYESTYHELVHLYPRLSPGGVLIIDDYGHWEGAKKAVDCYIEENKLKILLHRIDYTGRISVKLDD